MLGDDGCAGDVYSTLSGAAFLWSKLVGSVVQVVDLVCARCVGGCSAVFLSGVFFYVSIGGGGVAFPWSKYFVGSNVVVSIGDCFTGNGAAFLGSKLVGGVVEVVDRLCVDYIGGCGAAFYWICLRRTFLYHKFMHHVKGFSAPGASSAL